MILAFLSVLPFCVNFRISLLQKPCWDFDWNCIKSIDKFGENSYIDDGESTKSWTWHVSPFIYIFGFFHQHRVVSAYRSCTSFVRFGVKYLLSWRYYIRYCFSNFGFYLFFAGIWKYSWLLCVDLSCDATKAVLRGKIIALDALLEKDLNSVTPASTLRNWKKESK